MSDIFQIASIGLHDGQQRLEAISVNAASAALPGFRRHVVTGRPFDASLTAASSATQESPESTTPQPQRVDLRGGAPLSTNRALDVAIEADDLFFALGDGEQIWLTRAGAFHINEDGVLVGERGLHVLGANGDIVLPSEDVTVEADGRITYQGVVTGRLQLYRPNNRIELEAAQGTLLAASDGVQPAESGTWRVRGGTLEASNTDATREMLGMMALTRQFESLSRIVQRYDDVLGRAIQKFGEG